MQGETDRTPQRCRRTDPSGQVRTAGAVMLRETSPFPLDFSSRMSTRKNRWRRNVTDEREARVKTESVKRSETQQEVHRWWMQVRVNVNGLQRAACGTAGKRGCEFFVRDDASL